MRYSLVSLVLSVLLAACGTAEFSTTGPTGPGNTGSGPTGKPDASPWGGTPDFGKPQPPRRDAGACGGQDIPITLTKGAVPDLYLVVDKSGSMATPINLFAWHLGTKWDAMKKSLSGLVDAYKTNIRFGLSLYPSDSLCRAGRNDVTLGLGNNAAIKSRLNATRPTGNTPTHTTLDAAHKYLTAAAPGAGKRFALLATDGMPNCKSSSGSGSTGNETLAAVQRLAAAGIKTYVIGFGTIFAADPSLLNKLAIAGGVPNKTGANKFYAATNAAELKKTFNTIAGGLVPPPCTYKLKNKPPDPTKVRVTFDGKAIPQSLSNKDGWNYSDKGGSITLYGSACKRLQSGSVKNVKVAFGCKGPVIN